MKKLLDLPPKCCPGGQEPEGCGAPMAAPVPSPLLRGPGTTGVPDTACPRGHIQHPSSMTIL